MRWGAAKFVKGQARFAGDNSYDPEGEPNEADWFKATSVSDAKKSKATTRFLIDMAKPAFPRNLSDANVGAILKRCTIMLNTKENLYFRLAGVDSVTQRHPLLKGGYLDEGKGKILYDFKESDVLRDPGEAERLLGF